MVAQSLDADVIVIGAIDAGQLRPMTLAVVRELHRHMFLDDKLQSDALAAIDRGDQPSAMEALQSAMWAKMMSLGASQQSGLRLSCCLTRPDTVIDWELGEYLILWARQQKLSEEQIIAAFFASESKS
jgi:hypothetical protein